VNISRRFIGPRSYSGPDASQGPSVSVFHTEPPDERPGWYLTIDTGGCEIRTVGPFASEQEAETAAAPHRREHYSALVENAKLLGEAHQAAAEEDRTRLETAKRAADEAVNAYVSRFPGAATGEARPGEPDMRELPSSPPGSVQD
jgi:hypothetical protein